VQQRLYSTLPYGIVVHTMIEGKEPTSKDLSRLERFLGCSISEVREKEKEEKLRELEQRLSEKPICLCLRCGRALAYLGDESHTVFHCFYCGYRVLVQAGPLSEAELLRC